MEKLGDKSVNQERAFPVPAVDNGQKKGKRASCNRMIVKRRQHMMMPTGAWKEKFMSG